MKSPENWKRRNQGRKTRSKSIASKECAPPESLPDKDSPYDHNVWPYGQNRSTPALNAMSFLLIVDPGMLALLSVVVQKDKSRK